MIGMTWNEFGVMHSKTKWRSIILERETFFWQKQLVILVKI